MSQNGLTKLNPSASEFVPTSSFAMPAVQRNNYNPSYNNHNGKKPRHPNNREYNNHYNNNYNNNYNQNHYHNNGNNYNNRYNNTSNNSNGNYHRNSNNYFNPVDVDPIEIEARCEAVVEILQDDNIRDQLNSVAVQQQQQQQQQQQTSNFGPNDSAINQFGDEANGEPQCDDEDELFEMMAMQEECRMEMMKFYIQSQNPNLFEEIYHDVSYPDAVKPEVEESTNQAQLQQQQQQQLPQPVQAEKIEPSTTIINTEAPKTTIDEASVNSQDLSSPTSPASSASTSSSTTPLKDLLINNLNPDAYEFVPNKFSDLKISEDTKNN
jgi:hypothetical protein